MNVRILRVDFLPVSSGSKRDIASSSPTELKVSSERFVVTCAAADSSWRDEAQTTP
jgi:hypothetical protein